MEGNLGIGYGTSEEQQGNTVSCVEGNGPFLSLEQVCGRGYGVEDKLD